MSKRDNLLESIANTISDYRAGEIAMPTPDHVDRWVRQFDSAIQEALLAEVDYVLKKTYLSRKWICRFFGNQVKNKKLTGEKDCAFWTDANFFRIQQNGHSQEEMLELFNECLNEGCNIEIADCGSVEGPFIYLDDVLFSGSRIGTDLEKWIEEQAGPKATVHILVIATHALGEWQTKRRLNKSASASGKNIDFRFWKAVKIENRKTYRDASEVLWPVTIPDDAAVKAYVAEEDKFPFKPRSPGSTPKDGIFSSERGRQLLERELLLAGVRIRELCKNPSRAMRPLGFSAYGLGFGSTIVTFRNCPNNCPLALWWGDPDAPASSPLSKWYPLLPRKTYAREIDFDATEF